MSSGTSGSIDPPWIQLQRRRKKLGLTQSALAAGIVTQSMLCHIERGRNLPSEATLRALAERLGDNPDETIERWRAWRDRNRVRDQLWVALILDDADDIRRWLDHGGRLLVPFERAAYNALAIAIDGPTAEAGRALAIAASAARGRSESVASAAAGLMKFAEAGHGFAVVHLDRHGDPFAGAWTRVDRARALTAQARACWHLEVRAGNSRGAVYWKEQMADRLRDTVWTAP